MEHLRNPRRSGLGRLAVVCGAALALSVFAVGGSAVASAPAKTKAKQTVAVAKIPGVGTVLVDTEGKTVYTLTDNGTAVACTGGCASAWPPVMVAAGAKVKAPKGVTGLSATAGQVTAGGLPLYTFVGDTTTGVAKGEGIASFGGTWHVVKVTPATPKKSTKKSSSSSGG